MTSKIINLGGNKAADEERLFFKDFEFDLETGEHVVVKKSFIPNIDMGDLFARHKGRYYLLGLFARPGRRVLDFPCGSGYAANILKEFDVIYNGMDGNLLAVEYARRIYGGDHATFTIADMCNPNLPSDSFDVIGCIEGIEHIEQRFQAPLIRAFKDALKVGGTLIVSSPVTTNKVSGPSSLQAKWHKWELTKEDFVNILKGSFDQVELVTHTAVMSTGVLTTCCYGVCHKV